MYPKQSHAFYEKLNNNNNSSISLANMINESFLSGKYIDVLKISKCIDVYKDHKTT